MSGEAWQISPVVNLLFKVNDSEQNPLLCGYILGVYMVFKTAQNLLDRNIGHVL